MARQALDPEILEAAAADLATLARLWRKRRALIEAIGHEGDVSGRAPPEIHTQSASSCVVCGAPLPEGQRGGPPRQYCGRTCRQRGQAETRRRKRRQAPPAPEAPDRHDDATQGQPARPEPAQAGARGGSEPAARNGAVPIHALCEPPALPPASRQGHGEQVAPIGERSW